MAKQKNWFRWVKKLFISESNDKKWRWSLGRLKQKPHSTITGPNRTLIEASAEQRKHALTVAIATAAAAEAAIAAAHAAAEVVKLTGASHSSYSYLRNGDRSFAAIKIQSAYRAHLARKALRALKGVIRLQAIIRGQIVRRQVSGSSNNFPSNARNRVDIQERSSHTDEERYKIDPVKQFPEQYKLEEKELEHGNYSQRTWNCSLHSREEIESIWLRKQEAFLTRERMKQYSFSQRERQSPQVMKESMHNKEFVRESYPTLGQWLLKEPCDRDVPYKQASPLDLITMKKELQEEGISPQISISRKSFSHIKSSVRDDISAPNSPVFPTFMAVTKSSKAKARSMSTPRQRTGFLGVHSNQNDGIYLCSSYYDATSTSNENREVSPKSAKKPVLSLEDVKSGSMHEL
ncbi:hypothetical protein Lal_00033294 [Lupinus albus]|uniref:Putative IQ motif, EF-hand binding protein n=1 Tax=Lupinus albus TaxID=3870 RepID=A0A6A4QG61_LUPAL|nr:putative IQ motif, EF-hand binding protein [Lupinus albus]KAF1879636.1 hypothetical protein Lal_00033294 [Lupinus albus]